MSKYFNELEAKNLLSVYGIPMAKSGVAKTKEEAKSLAATWEFPIVMKVLSADIQHKTEAGCVFLKVEKTQVEDVYEKILCNAKRYASEAVIDGVLLQEMADSGLEVIVGMKRDPQFGPVLMVGMGGIYVEVINDVALRLLPVNREEISRMLEETKLCRIIRGARGTLYDEEVLIEILLRISDLAMKEQNVEEIDINPLFLYEKGKGAKGVDALMKVKS